jgi:hypothetical protein
VRFAYDGRMASSERSRGRDLATARALLAEPIVR